MRDSMDTDEQKDSRRAGEAVRGMETGEHVRG